MLLTLPPVHLTDLMMARLFWNGLLNQSERSVAGPIDCFAEERGIGESSDNSDLQSHILSVQRSQLNQGICWNRATLNQSDHYGQHINAAQILFANSVSLLSASFLSFTPPQMISSSFFTADSQQISHWCRNNHLLNGTKVLTA